MKITKEIFVVSRVHGQYYSGNGVFTSFIQSAVHCDTYDDAKNIIASLDGNYFYKIHKVFKPVKTA